MCLLFKSGPRARSRYTKQCMIFAAADLRSLPCTRNCLQMPACCAHAVAVDLCRSKLLTYVLPRVLCDSQEKGEYEQWSSKNE